jgi:hypothetical protein
METEWILLADHAEIINNKLYLMGGGWETLTVNQPLPVTHPCAVAVAFSVPWNETNQRHDIEIEIADQDAKTLARVEGQIEVGRPPGIPLGHAQRVPMAVNLGLTIEQLGTHIVSTRVEGQFSKDIRFNVVEGPGLALERMKARPGEDR